MFIFAVDLKRKNKNEIQGYFQFLEANNFIFVNDGMYKRKYLLINIETKMFCYAANVDYCEYVTRSYEEFINTFFDMNAELKEEIVLVKEQKQELVSYHQSKINEAAEELNYLGIGTVITYYTKE